MAHDVTDEYREDENRGRKLIQSESLRGSSRRISFPTFVSRIVEAAINEKRCKRGIN